MGASRKNVHREKKKEKTINKQQGSGIVCPECGGPTRVRRTFPQPEKSIQERFRICENCGAGINTQEKITEYTVNSQKIKNEE